jgi:Luciferase-like monooxygenase/FAD binding domain
MPDYGHDLAFGTFLTPRSQRPGDVVALAQLTERAGFDLVSFQDHPYQPAFLDAWTLLSWVAAQTQTLTVAPDVLNLPLRQPAVVARAAASLDLLSGGRVELGLGTGAFWDGIESMGGQRLSPGQAVGALGEAIEVIRGTFSSSVNRSHRRCARRSPGNVRRPALRRGRRAAQKHWPSGVRASTTTPFPNRWRPKLSSRATRATGRSAPPTPAPDRRDWLIRPDDAGNVRTALAFARAQDVPLSIRSGGHGISGRSTNDGGIVIDLGQLHQVEVLDRGTSRIRLGPGARRGNVAQALAPCGLGMSSGNFGDVGVGGLATTAGVGLLVRKHGLTIDHVLAAEVILADGTFVRADNEHHPDLFWALRGAGGNFGLVTAFELGAYPVRDVVFSIMLFDASPDLLTRWGQVIEQAPRELTSFLGIFGRAGSAPIAQLYTVYAGDDTKAAVQALTPLLSIGTLLDQQTVLIPYPAVIPPHGALHLGDGFAPASRSGLADHLTPQLVRSLLELIQTGISPMVQIRCVGGAVNDIDPLATAYAHRSQNFCGLDTMKCRP